MAITTETRSFLDAAKAATAVRRSGLDAPFASIENAIANARSEAFSLMRKWRAMELAETDVTVRGALEEYNQTLGALERIAAKALAEAQAMRRLAQQFEDVDVRLQAKFSTAT